MQPLPKNKNKVRFHLWNDSQPCSNYSNETHFFIAYFFYANGIIKYTWMCAVIFSFLFLHSAPNIANTCIAFVLSWWWLWSFVVFWQSKFKSNTIIKLNWAANRARRELTKTHSFGGQSMYILPLSWVTLSRQKI